MTERERFLETLLFGRPDRIPFSPGGPRESTLKAWRGQGLPEDVHWEEHLRSLIGIDPAPAHSGPGVTIDHRMIPQFEEKVIEEREDTLVVQDWKGNICEISKQFDVTYLRNPRDFVTRSWIKCPVETRDDWESMKRRYDPDDPSRIPGGPAELAKLSDDRDYVVGFNVPGPFWQMREWLGFEGLCIRFVEDPDLVRDMVAFWTGFISSLLMKVVPYVRIDFLHVSEDMAYKQKSMISPEMTREFLGPCYAEWGEILASHGCPIYAVDSDGYVGDLIPVWIDYGFNVCDPMEVAAGNDINQYRSAFGRRMGFRGGVDKRAIAKGGAVIRSEMARIEPVVRDGGFIPGCDHGVPSDVSWPCFVEYCDNLARMTGWK